jgi:hypothetical protein
MWLRVEHVPATLPALPDGAWATELCVADFRPGRLDAYARRLAADPTRRPPFPPSPPTRAHPTVCVVLPSGPADIDTAIAPFVAALNARGVFTDHCCQGDAKLFPAYIALKPGSTFPAELHAAWHGAGFIVQPDHVMARAPFGLWLLAAQRFQASGADWLAGRLDPTGARYRTTEPRPRLLPDWDVTPAARPCGPQLA